MDPGARVRRDDRRGPPPPCGSSRYAQQAHLRDPPCTAGGSCRPRRFLPLKGGPTSGEVAPRRGHRLAVERHHTVDFAEFGPLHGCCNRAGKQRGPRSSDQGDSHGDGYDTACERRRESKTGHRGRLLRKGITRDGGLAVAGIRRNALEATLDIGSQADSRHQMGRIELRVSCSPRYRSRPMQSVNLTARDGTSAVAGIERRSGSGKVA